jgi:hypothetical protein
LVLILIISLLAIAIASSVSPLQSGSGSAPGPGFSGVVSVARLADQLLYDVKLSPGFTVSVAGLSTNAVDQKITNRISYQTGSPGDGGPTSPDQFTDTASLEELVTEIRQVNTPFTGAGDCIRQVG